MSTFLGCSPIRRLAEDWDVEFMLQCVAESVTFAVNQERRTMPAVSGSVSVGEDGVMTLSLVNVHATLPADDPRWKSFGLNVPTAATASAQPQGLTAGASPNGRATRVGH